MAPLHDRLQTALPSTQWPRAQILTVNLQQITRVKVRPLPSKHQRIELTTAVRSPRHTSSPSSTAGGRAPNVRSLRRADSISQRHDALSITRLSAPAEPEPRLLSRGERVAEMTFAHRGSHELAHGHRAQRGDRRPLTRASCPDCTLSSAACWSNASPISPRVARSRSWMRARS